MHRGKLEDEITLKDAAYIWCLGHTRTWELVTKEGVIPYRRDRYRIYVNKFDVIDYEPSARRGRPPQGGSNGR